ncbi:HTTM domain-containing protein [Rhodobacteraceae bacterium]|nr:HTTM domain-containing protein [Paracoccaceae bacterium]
MSFEVALRLVEIGVSLALIQRAFEHIHNEAKLFLPQLILAMLLLSGLASGPAAWGLWALCLWQLYRFQGAYNGGADKLAMLCLTCLAVAHAAPTPFWSEMALAYLAVQLVLSYFISGWVKLGNPDWRSGAALRDVFALSAYPVAGNLRAISERQNLTLFASWAVIAFEIAFPFALASPALLTGALVIAAGFHLSNAILLGLNRFFWIWLSAFPALIWFQARMFV